MGTISETGHAVNISNFKIMIDTCTAYGAVYNPSNTDLTIVNMTTLWTAGNTAHQTLTTAVQNSKGPINEREILFKPADKLVTRTLNYFQSTKASAEIKLDAKGLADRFRGFGVGVEKLEDGSPDPADVSTSHQSYVQKADTFKQLIDLYASDANYAPNETELAITSLTTLWTNIKTLNDNIGGIIAPVEMARIARDEALYAQGTGIVDVSLACKDYVTGLFGAKSPEAKLITGIKIRRIKKI
ncbi:MAG: hypothetical protein ISS16_06915 [Ignavibacteria bacterium]|nr:hypothetical protein [Ignavibacteria bacterium]